MSQASQFALLGQRRFAPFFWTQFFGAGNDNVFKFAFTVLVTYQAALFGAVDAKNAAFVICAVFILPFVLFSATQRPARRQVRQGARDALRQVARDRHHGRSAAPASCCTTSRLLLPRHVPDGRALDAVRAGEVRLPAAAPERPRAHRRQRHGRDGHLRRDPARPIVGGELADLGADTGRLAVAAVCLGVAIVGRVVVGVRAGVAVRPARPRRSTGTRSPRPGATSSSRGRTSSCSGRCSASRGCGSSARRS